MEGEVCGQSTQVRSGTDMTIDIDQLTTDELIALNHRIVERLKFLGTMQAHRDIMVFSIRSRVYFDSKQERQLGTMTKSNRKTATVVNDNGQCCFSAAAALSS